ncbi:MAG TPA: glycoside hydrolase family 38 C-terminal domain-containing protein [Candidatus Binatus sp.]|uniref:glycoside hydrolase family 38 N-terminal domain-containing protein n=1 Tax=Candidatus Binatus sp. TaxID=2811406 RepID=UPI002B45DF73|nr:glycoside hydrolase family 38 C-terminal domain-containing protein [Candidatus Binatus sp.]HKN13846.1 glycoside hydrolase family 38 C-terminal domain-containing protein [Candidatus Binatus sp.]
MEHLYFVVHTHWDREWYQPFQRMRARLLTMMDKMLAQLESGALPCFHFDGQTIVLEDYLEVRPDSARRIAKLVKAGKLQIGPWYLLADSFLASGEALIRNLEIGTRIARRFGKCAETGYLPDQFGHAAQLPQILSGFGLKAAVTFRGVGREVNHNRFIWEALDGSALFTVFLPFGYFNGASIPTDSADATIARVNEIAAREREFSGGAPILVMNGNDHAEPDVAVFERLKEAAGRALFTAEVGTLDEYMARLAELPVDGTPRVRGELRSPARSNLTPGVSSSRAWIKQRDFQNSYLLERIADPLAALASLSSRADDLTALLEVAWRTEIQNHPHDSICGCSIDQVHQDMRYRFDQAAMIGEIVARRASNAVLATRNGGDPAIAVFNPTFARRALVTGETEVEDPHASYVAMDSDGCRIPVAIDIARLARPFEIELKGADFKGLIAGAQVMGQYVNRFELERDGDNRFDLRMFVSRSAAGDLDPNDFRRRILEVPDEAIVRIRATAAARAQITFVADALTQAGFSLYRLVRSDEPAAGTPASAPGGESIENEYFRLSPSSRGLKIDDLKNNQALEIYFEDDGDRGDEYNFDPVADSAAISKPASLAARVIEHGTVKSRIALSSVLNLPSALTKDRSARAAETVEVPIQLTATIYAGLQRVDFDAEIDNRARDHRIRIALSTPIAASESLSDTNFGIVRRSIDPTEPAGVTEDIYPTAPHRTFTAVQSAELSAAMMSRGIYETEARRDAGGTTILLTLLRCVGWLSRKDLKMRRGDAGPEFETPDAQEIGPHRFQFAVTTWRRSYADTGVVQLSQAYAYPPRVFQARSAMDVSENRLCACDNPRVEFSTARATDRARAYIVRAFSASESPETARFSFGAGRKARLVDLAGRPLKGVKLKRRRDGSVEMELRPFQIVTFEVRSSTSKSRRA